MSTAAASRRLADLLDNPIIRREAVPRLIRRASPSARAVLAALALGGSFVLGAYLATLSEGFSQLIASSAVGAWAGLSLLVAALSSSRAIAQERMSGTWDALIMSRLGGRAIVLGKLLGTLLPLWTVGVILLPMVLLLLAAGRPDSDILHAMLVAYGGAIVGGTAAASLGLYCSMRCRTVATAQFLTIVLGVVIVMVAQGGAMGLIFAAGGMSATYVYGGALYGLVYFTLLLAPGLGMLWDMLARFDTLERHHRRT